MLWRAKRFVLCSRIGHTLQRSRIPTAVKMRCVRVSATGKLKPCRTKIALFANTIPIPLAPFRTMYASVFNDTSSMMAASCAITRSRA